MAALSHPLVGDSAYGNGMQITKGTSRRLRADILGFKRQALHAQALAFIHPVTGEKVQRQAPLPDDMQSLLNMLEQHAAKQHE